jgi:hypothetical protein
MAVPIQNNMRKFKIYAAKAVSPLSSPAGCYEAALSHLHQAGPA